MLFWLLSRLRCVVVMMVCFGLGEVMLVVLVSL